ncbi:cupredoxin domain-containing protein [Novosphingobium tardum]|uniref:Cupredoxin domain-containing protein n=1 Tax=Novosphingobium tardum TaxID=1538021 RepID=A0ABV8RLW6_9SPHN
MLRKLAFVALALALPGAAQGQAPQPRVSVLLSSFKFTPKVIHLRAGQPIVLHLENTGSGGHDFSAPQFFAAATIAAADRAAIVDGTVQVGSRESRDIALTPAAGTYSLKCTHTMHKMFGMSGKIVVS